MHWQRTGFLNIIWNLSYLGQDLARMRGNPQEEWLSRVLLLSFIEVMGGGKCPCQKGQFVLVSKSLHCKLKKWPFCAAAGVTAGF